MTTFVESQYSHTYFFSLLEPRIDRRRRLNVMLAEADLSHLCVQSRDGSLAQKFCICSYDYQLMRARQSAICVFFLFLFSKKINTFHVHNSLCAFGVSTNLCFRISKTSIAIIQYFGVGSEWADDDIPHTDLRLCICGRITMWNFVRASESHQKRKWMRKMP